MGAPPSAGTVLQLVDDAPHAGWGECLNVQVPWYGDAHPASQVSKDCMCMYRSVLVCCRVENPHALEPVPADGLEHSPTLLLKWVL